MNRKRVGFVSNASFQDRSSYHQKVVDALAPLSLDIVHLDLENNHAKNVLESVEGIMVGGGNTYRLLQSVYKSSLKNRIRERVLQGIPYIGWSAGANLAGPTILTTNDWNVVGWNQFEAFHFVPFNINPHYLETDLTMAPHSETRDMRIAEYHHVHSNMVLGIEEQTSLWIEDGKCVVRGLGRVRKFLPNIAPKDFSGGQSPF